MKISNWGNYPVIDARVQEIDQMELFRAALNNSHHLIARGLGRCYGDSALSETILSTQKFNRFIAFDDKSGLLTCEAGVSIEDILETFVPRGWFPPVTPGTKFVTIGGAIASDVHGKNHHIAGSLSNHVRSLDIMLSNGEIQTCGPNENSDLFWATCGGMGLTGIIIQATLQLVPINSAYIEQEVIRARNLEHIMDLFEESSNWTYTVSWIDCLAKGDDLGRSILMRGEHADTNNHLLFQKIDSPLHIKEKKKINIPFNFPNCVLNPWSVKAFNFLYYNKSPKEISKTLIDYDQFFYPLDAILHWNRIYGRRGFTQYQFVLPKESSKEGMRKVLTETARTGMGSFLGVLKLFGKQNNLLSFPTEGYTMTLDFAINQSLFPFLDRLDTIILDHGGRLYLTKDVRMSESLFTKTYANSAQFKRLKHQFDPDNKFQSLQSRRIGI